MPKLQQEDLAKLLPKEILDLNLIVLMEFGSKLYGTDTPESDMDFKGIYLPTKNQILLNRIPKSVSYRTKPDKKDEKNTKDDIDCQVFSLHYFLELASKGETAAIDMLHAPDDWPLYSSDLWVDIRKRRQMFYSKNLKAFVSYARKQVAKYGLKGIDWKAMSHALRAATEVTSILTKGDIIFPLQNAEFLRKVKQGKYDFSATVLPLLETYMGICEEAAMTSSLPDSVDLNQIDNLLIEVLRGIYETKK